MKLTPAEKEAIRNSPCGVCGSVPPFDDGARCHTHRPVPVLGYVHGNVVPRCPDCHAQEPAHPAVVRRAHIGGHRVHELHPEHASNWGKRYGPKGGRSRMADLGPDERTALARAARRKSRVNEVLTPEQKREYGRRGGTKGGPKAMAILHARLGHEGLSAIGKRGAAALHAGKTPEERSALVRKGWETRRAKRAAS